MGMSTTSAAFIADGTFLLLHILWMRFTVILSPIGPAPCSSSAVIWSGPQAFFFLSLWRLLMISSSVGGFFIIVVGGGLSSLVSVQMLPVVYEIFLLLSSQRNVSSWVESPFNFLELVPCIAFICHFQLYLIFV